MVLKSENQLEIYDFDIQKVVLYHEFEESEEVQDVQVGTYTN